MTTQVSPLQALDWAGSFGSLADVVRARAAQAPHTTAVRFLDFSSEKAQEELLDSELLDRRARQIAALLQSRARAGARILLLYPAGPEFLCFR